MGGVCIVVLDNKDPEVSLRFKVSKVWMDIVVLFVFLFDLYC